MHARCMVWMLLRPYPGEIESLTMDREESGESGLNYTARVSLPEGIGESNPNREG